MELLILLCMGGFIWFISKFADEFVKARDEILSERKGIHIYVEEVHPTVFIAYNDENVFIAQAHSYPALLTDLTIKFPNKTLLIEGREVES